MLHEEEESKEKGKRYFWAITLLLESTRKQLLLLSQKKKTEDETKEQEKAITSVLKFWRDAFTCISLKGLARADESPFFNWIERIKNELEILD